MPNSSKRRNVGTDNSGSDNQFVRGAINTNFANFSTEGVGSSVVFSGNPAAPVNVPGTPAVNSSAKNSVVNPGHTSSFNRFQTVAATAVQQNLDGFLCKTPMAKPN